MLNLVEMLADDDESSFDQPCKYGNRVDGHAVYCHNETWKDAPRKCRQTWYWGKEKDREDKDCKGFSPNAEYKGE